MVCLLGIPVAVHAQEARGTFREAGAWLSLVRATNGGTSVDSSVADRIPVLGLAAGAFARLELARWRGVGLGLQLELDYAPRGSDVEIDGVYQGGHRYRYLEIPVLARMEAPPLGPAAFYLVGGPSLGVLLSAESESLVGVISDVTDGTSKLDLGLSAGAGFVVPVTRRLSLGVETRYTHGFVTVEATRTFDIEHRALLFSLGVAIRPVRRAASLTERRLRAVSAREVCSGHERQSHQNRGRVARPAQ
jgi:opacity protein-like surface antigen